jgi:hypothetical protein
VPVVDERLKQRSIARTTVLAAAPAAAERDLVEAPVHAPASVGDGMAAARPAPLEQVDQIGPAVWGGRMYFNGH